LPAISVCGQHYAVDAKEAGMLNIVANKTGAHSETLSMFYDLCGEAHIFYPHPVHTSSLEPEMRATYGCDFIKSVDGLRNTILDSEDHGVFIFNSSWEIQEEWAVSVLPYWRGKIAVYHHDMLESGDPALAQFYAHPFKGTDKYLLPVSRLMSNAKPSAVDRKSGANKATIVVPNWSRPTQLEFKDLPFLSDFVETHQNLDFIFTGMKLELMEKARDKIKSPNRINILEQLNAKQLYDLLTCPCTYIMPLITPGGRYATRGLTGSIPLGISNLCPLIMSAEIASVYELGDGYLNERLVDADELNDLEFYNGAVASTENLRSRRAERNKAVYANLLHQ
jgi:hypothetical protein